MNLWLQLYIDAIVFMFGAVTGSFLNVCVYRMPREESLVRPRSHCPNCQQMISWHDNIPLVSFLWLRGRCRHCGAKITPRYFVVELLTGLLFLFIWIQRSPSHLELVPVYWLLASGLIAATFIDFEHYIIPNEITLGGVVVGLLLSVALPALQHTASHGQAALRSVVGIVSGGAVLLLIAEIGKLAFGRLKVPLPLGTLLVIADQKLKLPDEEIAWAELFFRPSDKIRFKAATLKFADKQFENASVLVWEDRISVNGQEYLLAEAGAIEATTSELIIPREAMGLGDVKLLAAIGAFLGWQATAFSIFLSSLVGSLVSLTLILIGKRDLHSRIPYGPYIALGAIVWVFAQNNLLAIFDVYMEGLRDFVMHVFSRG